MYRSWRGWDGGWWVWELGKPYRIPIAECALRNPGGVCVVRECRHMPWGSIEATVLWGMETGHHLLGSYGHLNSQQNSKWEIDTHVLQESTKIAIKRMNPCFHPKGRENR